MRRVLLEEHADRAGGQQEADDAVLVGAGHEVDVVVQHGRDDAGGAVGRGGDDPAAGGVLLVDGHRVERDPLHRARQRVALGPQLAGASVGGPAAHLAGRRAAMPSRGQPRSTQACMTCPDLQQARRGSPPRSRQAVSFSSISAEIDRPVSRAQPQQLVAGAEGILQDGVVELDPVLARPRPRRRRSRRRPSSTSSPQRARCRRRRNARERHPVGVVRQRLAAVQDQVARRRRRRSRAVAEQRQPARPRIRSTRASRRARRRPCAGESPSSPSRTAFGVPCPWPVAPSEPNSSARTAATCVQQPVGPRAGAAKMRGRAHRADRVRAGRADADREQVEDGDGHGNSWRWRTPSPGGGRRAGGRRGRGAHRGRGPRALVCSVRRAPPGLACRTRTGASGRVERVLGGEHLDAGAQLREVRLERVDDDVRHLGEVTSPKPRVASAGVPMRSPR